MQSQIEQFQQTGDRLQYKLLAGAGAARGINVNWDLLSGGCMRGQEWGQACASDCISLAHVLLQRSWQLINRLDPLNLVECRAGLSMAWPSVRTDRGKQSYLNGHRMPDLKLKH